MWSTPSSRNAHVVARSAVACGIGNWAMAAMGKGGRGWLKEGWWRSQKESGTERDNATPPFHVPCLSHNPSPSLSEFTLPSSSSAIPVPCTSHWHHTTVLSLVIRLTQRLALSYEYPGIEMLAIPPTHHLSATRHQCYIHCQFYPSSNDRFLGTRAIL